jgi:hypothetical protein
MQVDSLVQTLVVGPQQMQTYSLILRPQFLVFPTVSTKKRAANLFVEAKAARMQAALKAIGLDSELV